jgi:hypothetical protein
VKKYLTLQSMLVNVECCGWLHSAGIRTSKQFYRTHAATVLKQINNPAITMQTAACFEYQQMIPAFVRVVN